MNRKASLEILRIHQANLAKAKTFEEYRDAHAAYVGMLIEKYEIEEKRDKIVSDFTSASWRIVTEVIKSESDNDR